MALDTNHYIDLKNGQFDSTTRDDLDKMFKAFSASPNHSTLVVHFHGGVVPKKAGMAVAERLLPVYESAGGYPVFFVWESGVSEVMTHNIDEIFNEKIFGLLLKQVTQFAVAKLTQTAGARSAGRLQLPGESDVDKELSKLGTGGRPYSELTITLRSGDTLRDSEAEQFMEQADPDDQIKQESVRIANSFLSAKDIADEREKTRGITVHGASKTLMSPDLIEEINRQADARRETRSVVAPTFVIEHALSVLKRVVVRFAKKRGHDVYPTVAEEILREFYLSNAGGFVWGEMKKDTADAFQDDDQQFGGTAFLQGIKGVWQAGQHPRIILIGHSAGAVYICNFLKFAQQRLPPEIKFDVVFLAPACTVSVFADTLATSAQRINKFRIFTMDDTHEKANQLVKLVYPHSLLYFISGVLEKESDTPIVGMQRFYTAAPPFDAAAFPEIERVRSFLNKIPERAVWSVEDSGPGRTSNSTNHSDFDDDPNTLASLQYIIGHGF